jgi:curved DNA-binding protein CbpA
MKAAPPVDLALARALADCGSRGHSGVCTAVRGKLKRLFCIEDGFLVHAASNLIEEQFSEILVRDGLVSLGDLASARQVAECQGLRLSRLLLTGGRISEAALVAAIEQHVRDLLFSTLDWNEGGCRFARGRPDLGDDVRVQLAPVPLLLDYARSHPASLDAVRRRVGPDHGRLALREERRGLLGQGGPDGTAPALLAAWDADKPIAEQVESLPGAPEANWRSIYALTLIGVLDGESGHRLQEAALTREEVESTLDRLASTDHYSILGLTSNATRMQVREAYYVLARRYHPDRFNTGPLQDMRQRMEGYFACVTEAYNTLYDPALRSAYDQQRSTEGGQARPEQDVAFLARENFRRAQALIARGRLKDAVTSLENAIQLDDRNAVYRLELGRLLARNPRMRNEAEAHLIEANRIDPALSAGYLELGLLYAKSQRPDDAARLFREVLRWEPGHQQALAQLAELGVSV